MGECLPCVLDCELPDWQTTVCSLPALCVRQSGLQNWSSTGQSCHLQKYSDDSAIVGCISGGVETEYRTTVDNFVTWCERNHLQLNVTKAKELVVDLRMTKSPMTPVSIHRVSVDMLEDYKYLGVHMNIKLDWTQNSEAVYKKGQTRLYFLRRLKSFNICRTMLKMFYESVVASAIFLAVVCCILFKYREECQE